MRASAIARMALVLGVAPTYAQEQSPCRVGSFDYVASGLPKAGDLVNPLDIQGVLPPRMPTVSFKRTPCSELELTTGTSCL